MFTAVISEELESTLDWLYGKNRHMYRIIRKKIDEILSCDLVSIQRYKNLRAPLNYLKRVHINGHFVLAFELKGDKIFFIWLKHHDDAYK
jgi:mRNA-degrading endonuclease RelE of RelBE toxin-antitoxin system